MSGLILLVLIGVGAAWLFTSGRKKLKLPVNGKHWVWVIIIVVVVLALAYGATHQPHQHIP
jgi:drug/metabolite transporter (DMT)-like permease